MKQKDIFQILASYYLF